MTDLVQNVLGQYGQKVVLHTSDGDLSVRAFLQPVQEKREQVPGEITSLGWLDKRLWLYLGQTEPGLQDTIAWNGMTFRVRSCRAYYIGEALSHYWAVLEQAKEAAL